MDTAQSSILLVFLRYLKVTKINLVRHAINYFLIKLKSITLFTRPSKIPTKNISLQLSKCIPGFKLMLICFLTNLQSK